MFLMKRILPAGILGLLLCSASGAQEAWVSDEFEIMMRTGPSTNNAIERVLSSGTPLAIVEVDAETGYSRVRTNAGTEGWVLSRYLMDEPSAREQLSRLTGQLTDANNEGSSLTSQLDAVRGEYNSANNRIAVLEREKKSLEQELAEIKRTAANVLAIDKQNKDLRDELATTQIKVSTVEQENRELSGESTRTWFMTGALVLLVGVILGLWLPRIRWQKRSRYDRF